MNILIPQDDEYVSDKLRLCWPLSLLNVFLSLSRVKSLFYSYILGCSTEGVSSTGAVQDCLGRLQTGDGTY